MPSRLTQVPGSHGPRHSGSVTTPTVHVSIATSRVGDKEVGLVSVITDVKTAGFIAWGALAPTGDGDVGLSTKDVYNKTKKVLIS